MAPRRNIPVGHAKLNCAGMSADGFRIDKAMGQQ